MAWLTWEEWNLVQLFIKFRFHEVDAAVIAECSELWVNNDLFGPVAVSLPVSYVLSLLQVCPVAARAKDEADGALVVVVNAFD